MRERERERERWKEHETDSQTDGINNPNRKQRSLMRCCVFDLETFTLAANTGVLLCCAYKEYGSKKPPSIIRADDFPTWKNERSNVQPVVEKVLAELDDFDIYVAHNGQFFDKPMLTSWAIKYSRRPTLRVAKFVDPVLLARRHMKLTNNSLSSLLDFLGIPEKKTPIAWHHWMRAAFDGNKESLNYIVEHCVRDVIVLEKAYDKTKRLVKGIDERGSSF